MSEMVYVHNTTDNPYCFADPKGGLISVPADSTVEVPCKSINDVLLKKELLVIVDAPAAPVVEEPPAGDDPLTVEQMGQKLKDEPELLSEDDMTGAGVPSVDALNRVFEREDITAEMRDEIWELAEDDGSDD